MSTLPSDPQVTLSTPLAVTTGTRGSGKEDRVASQLEQAEEQRKQQLAPSSPPDLLWIAPPPLLQRAPNVDISAPDPSTTVPTMPRLIPARGDVGFFLGQQRHEEESRSSLGSYSSQPPPYSLFPQSLQYPFFQPHYGWPQPYMLPGGAFSMPVPFPSELHHPPIEQHDATHKSATASLKTTRSPAAILHLTSK